MSDEIKTKDKLDAVCQHEKLIRQYQVRLHLAFCFRLCTHDSPFIGSSITLDIYIFINTCKNSFKIEKNRDQGADSDFYGFGHFAVLHIVF